MESYINKVTGNPIPLLVGAFLGHYIGGQMKHNGSQKIIATIAGGLIVSAAYIKLTEKKSFNSDGTVGELPPVIGIKQTKN